MSNAKQPSPKPSLAYLEKWAESARHCVFVFSDNSALVLEYNGSRYIQGHTRYQALCKAHKAWKENK